MNTLETEPVPHPQESLAQYIRRVRQERGLSQRALAERAGVHLHSIGKLERGKTARLNRKTQSGLAFALQVPPEHLEAIERGLAIEPSPRLKFCPHCWRPGTPADPLWAESRAKYCCLCGSALRHQCWQCKTPIGSLKHRFCPHCGMAYQSKQPSSV